MHIVPPVISVIISIHVTFHQSLGSKYTVTRLVRMEGLWMQELVCVTVQMASVGQIVKVSTLRGAQSHYALLDIICGTNTSLNGSCEGFFFHVPNSHFTNDQ